jgi:hypothetical protein
LGGCEADGIGEECDTADEKEDEDNLKPPTSTHLNPVGAGLKPI